MRLTSGFAKSLVVLAGFGLVGVIGCAKPDSGNKPKPAAKDEGGSGAAVGGGVATPGKTEEASPTSEPAKTEGDKPAETAKEGDKPAEPAKTEGDKPAEPAKEGDKPADAAKPDEKPAEGDKK